MEILIHVYSMFVLACSTFLTLIYVEIQIFFALCDIALIYERTNSCKKNLIVILSGYRDHLFDFNFISYSHFCQI